MPLGKEALRYGVGGAAISSLVRRICGGNVHVADCVAELLEPQSSSAGPILRRMGDVNPQKLKRDVDPRRWGGSSHGTGVPWQWTDPGDGQGLVS